MSRDVVFAVAVGVGMMLLFTFVPYDLMLLVGAVSGIAIALSGRVINARSTGRPHPNQRQIRIEIFVVAVGLFLLWLWTRFN